MSLLLDQHEARHARHAADHHLRGADVTAADDLTNGAARARPVAHVAGARHVVGVRLAGAVTYTDGARHQSVVFTSLAVTGVRPRAATALGALLVTGHRDVSRCTGCSDIMSVYSCGCGRCCGI